MAWKLLDHVDDYPDGEPFHHHDHQRVYGWNGQQWPKLVITIRDEVTHNPVVGEDLSTGLLVSCSAQKTPRRWWRDHPIPVELLGDLIELLKVYQASGV